MNSLKRLNPIVLIASLLVAIGAAGCVYAPVRGGPPPQAPAYGYYDYYYDYYYYPSIPLYFHIYTGDYYYRDHDRWIRTKVLPRNIHLYHNDRVQIRIKDDQPYRYYSQHQQQYRPNRNLHYDRNDDQRERNYNRQQYEQYRTRPDRYEGDGHHHR